VSYEALIDQLFHRSIAQSKVKLHFYDKLQSRANSKLAPNESSGEENCSLIAKKVK
jgi:hypothetical protein